jgi:C_GCAxxG_C_C family probable redox protein
LSFKEYFGYKDSVLPGLATGFGGGIGLKGSFCGAFIGSVMAIGMKAGRINPRDRETALKVYEKCREFWDRFEKEFGNVNCYSLIGYHLDNLEENKQWLATGGRDKCAGIVEKTAQMLCDFLAEKK